MSIITVSQLRDYFKNVSDWVTGSSASRPKLVLTGQNEADGTNGEAVSFVLDNDNIPVLRFTDAAPFSYDGTADAKKVKNVSADGTEIFTSANPGIAKLSDGTDALAINTNGSINLVPVDSAGTELFSASNPGVTELSGSNALKGAVQAVTTAGTRVQLPNYVCREVTIIAKRVNTGYIYVGGNDVSDTVYGAELAAKDSITIAVENTNLIYIDASVNGEGISYVAI